MTTSSESRRFNKPEHVADAVAAARSTVSST